MANCQARKMAELAAMQLYLMMVFADELVLEVLVNCLILDKISSASSLKLLSISDYCWQGPEAFVRNTHSRRMCRACFAFYGESEKPFTYS